MPQIGGQTVTQSLTAPDTALIWRKNAQIRNRLCRRNLAGFDGLKSHHVPAPSPLTHETS
jgi:hypothetical protein